MKGILLVLTFVIASAVAIQKDPWSLLDFGNGYRIRHGRITDAYRETVERVKYAVTEGARLSYEGWMWTRGTLLD